MLAWDVDMDSIQVTAEKPQVVTEKSKPYVIYGFSITCGVIKTLIRGRYSELLKMHERLMRNPKSRKVLLRDKRGTHSKFPKKSWWYVDMTKPSNYDQRNVELLKYYELLYTIPKLLQIDVFHEVMEHDNKFKLGLRDLAQLMGQSKTARGSKARKPRSSTTSSAGGGPSTRQSTRRVFLPRQHPPRDDYIDIDVSNEDADKLMSRETKASTHLVPKALEIDDHERAYREESYARIMHDLGPVKLSKSSSMVKAIKSLPISVYDLKHPPSQPSKSVSRQSRATPLHPTSREDASRILQFLARPVPDYPGTKLAYDICDEVVKLMTMVKPDELDQKNFVKNAASGGGSIHNAHYMLKNGQNGNEVARSVPEPAYSKPTGDPNALVLFLQAPQKASTPASS